MPDDTPSPEQRLHIDESWKSEAARAKEVLQDSAAKSADQKTGPAPPLPEASFAALVTGLRAQALLALGLLADPATGADEADLEQAKYVIDLLGMLEKKTAGNLTDDEKQLLDAVLYDLRMAYLRM